MQAAAGAGRTGGGDAGTRGSGSSVLQGAEPRLPLLPDDAAATSPGDTSATGRHGAGGRLRRDSESPGSGWRAAAGPFPAPLRPAPECAELSPPGEPADPPLLLPRLPPSSHVMIRLHGPGCGSGPASAPPLPAEHG